MTKPTVQLTWPGKRTELLPLETPPVLHIAEQYGSLPLAQLWARGPGAKGFNRLICGDNRRVMAALQADYAGRFALIYLDPPFFTGAAWQAKSAGGATQSAYSDTWNNDLSVYLQWLTDRLLLARDLLAETGSLYLHLSWQAAHYAKLLLDEIFGVSHFQNEVIWAYREAINSKKRWNRKHDTLLFYSKTDDFTFNYDAVREPYADSHIKKYRLRDDKGLYRLMGRGITSSPIRSRRDVPAHYETTHPDLTYRHYLGEGALPTDTWRIDIENQSSATRTGYPTQKPEALLERILLASTNPGDLIGDFCCGSGTTLAVAERLARRWIACDAGQLAIHTTRKRLLNRKGECPAFTVESEKNIPTIHEANEIVCVVRTGDGIQITLQELVRAQTDMWAIGWGTTNDATPFRPQWQAFRTRQQPDLIAVSPVLPLPANATTLHVLLIDAAGHAKIWHDPL